MERLPDEILVECFKYMGPRTRYAIACNMRMRRLARSLDYWIIDSASDIQAIIKLQVQPKYMLVR